MPRLSVLKSRTLNEEYEATRLDIEILQLFPALRTSVAFTMASQTLNSGVAPTDVYGGGEYRRNVKPNYF